MKTFKNSSEGKIKMNINPKFMSSTDSNEKLIMCTKSDNTDIIISKDIDEIVQELFGSLLRRYQTGLEQFMKISNFVFDYVNIFDS